MAKVNKYSNEKNFTKDYSSILNYPGKPSVSLGKSIPSPSEFFSGKVLDKKGCRRNKERRYKAFMTPVKYDVDKAHRLADKFVIDCKDRLPDDDEIKKAIKTVKYYELLPCLLKFVRDLRDWSPHKSKKATSPENLLYECLVKGPAFYDVYKERVRNAMEKAMGCKYPYGLEYKQGSPIKDLWDGPDSWFDMRFTIFWDLKSNDSDYMFSVKKEDIVIEEDDMQRFSLAISSILPKKFSIKEDIFKEYNTSSAKSFNPFSESDRTRPEWLEAFGEVYDDEEPCFNVVKGIQIPKCAGETRDGVTLHINTKRILTKVGSAISQLISSEKGIRKLHPSDMDNDEMDSRLEHLSSKYAHFFCKDFAKIGLTLPIPIISETLSSCYSITEYEPFLEAKNFFETLRFRKDGNERDIIRGFCLGLFNEGMTLVQLALHKMNLDDSGLELDGMFLNDDSVVGSETMDEIREYARHDEINCDALCIVRKDKKSFISTNFFVFCEEYYRDGDKIPKKCLRKYAYNSCYYMPTIRKAKEMYNSVCTQMGPDIEKLHDLMNVWGYEFFKTEAEAPFEFGGWFSSYRNGYNTALIQYYDNSDWYWAWRSINQRLKSKGTIGDKPTQPLGRVINACKSPMGPIDLDIDLELKMEDLFGSKKAISFFRMQTEKGNDNTSFYLDLEQEKKVEYFKKNRYKLPDLNVYEELMLKGYVPSLIYLNYA
jgi:hypothetical protein